MEVLDQSAKKYQKAKSEGRLTSLGDSSSDPYSSKVSGLTRPTWMPAIADIYPLGSWAR